MKLQAFFFLAVVSLFGSLANATSEAAPKRVRISKDCSKYDGKCISPGEFKAKKEAKENLRQNAAIAGVPLIVLGYFSCLPLMVGVLAEVYACKLYSETDEDIAQHALEDKQNSFEVRVGNLVKIGQEIKKGKGFETKKAL